MSTMVTTAKITRRYLENKTKSDLISMILFMTDLQDANTIPENWATVLMCPDCKSDHAIDHSMCGSCGKKPN